MQYSNEFLMFHASKHSFDVPNIEMLAKNRENHSNGALGLWVAEKSDWIGGFGEYLYEVSVNGVVKDLPIEELSQWSKQSSDVDFYELKRKELLDQGVQYLRLVELNGRSVMGVVLDFDAIKHFIPADRPVETIRPRG